MIIYRKAALRIAELWFDEEDHQSGFDIIRYFQRTAPMSKGAWTRFCTLVIELSPTPEVLLSNMKKDTRHEIRRADGRDNLVYHLWTSVDQMCLARFISFYDQYAATKATLLGRHQRVRELAKTDALALSEVRDEGGTLGWHAYYCTRERVRLLHSAFLRDALNSSRRSMLGRANRLLHWKDILAFRQLGVRSYDLGGWYEGKADQKKLSINRFKEEFGGQTVIGYNGQLGVTFAGKMALWCYARVRGSGLL